MIKKILKSLHFWFWLSYLSFTAFTYFYPRIAVYTNIIDDIFAELEWFFIWFIFSVIALGIYCLFALNED